ncbi:MAG TPA: VanZ family protein [Parvularculaceae bacterium]|nr:VanZ family protein [Parvularculaceae bacterium]
MSFILAARALFAVLFVTVAWLILTPNPQDTEAGMDIARWIAKALFGDPDLGDKVAHVSAFAALAGTAALGRLRILGSGALMVAALSLYGGALEIGQLLGGVRDADWMDALADALGAVAAYPAAAFLAGLTRRGPMA